MKKEEVKHYRIGDYAQKMGVTPDLLKHYEKMKLIHAYTEDNGYRYYPFTESIPLLESLSLRNYDLSLQEIHELLYEDRKLVDYVDKELSIWPTEDWPYFSSYRELSLEMGETFEGMKELKKRAITYIRENGPVCSDTLPIEGEIYWHSSMHWSGNWDKKSQAARSVLEQLYTDGELIIHHKNGSRKYYDLAEQYISKDILERENPCMSEEDYIAWRVLRRIGAVGLI